MRTTLTPDSPARWRNRIAFVDREGKDLPREVSVAALRANPRNWRKHPEGQMHVLRTLLGEVGWVDTVKINLRYPEDGWPCEAAEGGDEPAEPTLVDGHARVEEAEKRGEPTVPATWLRLSPDEERKILLGFDLVTGMAEADNEAMARLAATIETDDRHFRQVLDQILEGYRAAESPGIAPEDVPDADLERAAELAAKWGTAEGQIWEIPSRTVPGGLHRLAIADATRAATLEQLMSSGERLGALVTDPPYNVGIDYGASGARDDHDPVAYAAFTRTWFGLWKAERAIVTPGLANLGLWMDFARPKHVAPWIIPNGMTHGSVASFLCWEPILFVGEKFPRRRSNDLFTYPLSEQKAEGVGSLTGLHPCPKPIGFWCDLFENYAEGGELVGEPFGGSGTGFAAAEATGRLCRGAEISPAYAAVILERMAGLGLEPKLRAEEMR